MGEPPFTFTYQRSEPSPKRGGKPGRVLETHTVSRVYVNEYIIYSALEGLWSYSRNWVRNLGHSDVRYMDCNIYHRSLLSLSCRTGFERLRANNHRCSDCISYHPSYLTVNCIIMISPRDSFRQFLSITTLSSWPNEGRTSKSR